MSLLRQAQQQREYALKKQHYLDCILKSLSLWTPDTANVKRAEGTRITDPPIVPNSCNIETIIDLPIVPSRDNIENVMHNPSPE